MHLIASTFNRPSAVSYSLACSFRGSEERFLAVLRTDRLLIYVLKPHGTELVCEREIWGQTRGLLQLETSKHLVVSLDIPRAKIIVIDFNPRTFELTTHHTSTISPLSHRPSVGFSGTIGRDQTVCASFYNGHVKVLQVGSQAPYEVKESDLRVHELTIQSMCFTLPASDSVLAIVYTEQNGNACIIGRNIDTMDPSPHIPEKELTTVPDLVIPVRIESATDETVFGILLFARKLVTFLKPGGNIDHGEDRDSKKGKSKPRSSRSKSEVKAAIQAGMVTTEVPFNDVSAWTQVDGTHLVIGDSYGRLFLLSMSVEPEFKASTVLLGQVSVPSTLSYLSNNVLYVGSESGPSQLVRIATDLTSQDNVVSFGKKKQPDEDTSKIEILVTHNENIAPIMDAALVDPDGSGQSRIATISGDDSGGRLNVIHKGASFRELAIMEGSANLDNVFPLKKYFDAPNHVYLVATTNTSTFLLTLSESSLTLMSPDDLPGISRTGQTVLVANVNIPGFDAVIHITPNSAALVDLNTGRGFGSWNPPRGDITAASVDTGSSVVCIATSEGYLYCLSMQLEGLVKTSEYSFRSRAHSQVSALTISSHMVAAAFWGSNDVQMLKLPGLQKLPQAIPAEPFAASNVLLTNFGEDQMYLIAARLDGALVVQAISPDGTPLSGSKRVVPLGGGPIQLASAPIPDSSLTRVVAAGKRGVALSIINKRLSVSALPILDVCALASANPPGIGPSIVYASSSGLVFGQIEQLDKLNISSASRICFHLGSDSPLRLAHHSGLSTYIIGCVRTGIDTIEERHIVRFLDDATFKDLGQVKLKYSEIVTSITTYSHEGSLCVFVGTGILSTGENEPQSGRIIMFKAEAESGMFRLEASKDVDGAVSSIKQLGARIVAAINHGVYAYDIGSDEPNIGEYIAKWERGYILDDLVIREDTIVVSDKLRSVSVLRLVPPITEADDEDDEDDEDDFIDRGRGLNQRWQFETIAMDMHAVWPTSVEVLEGGTIIAAQLDGNILTWELDDGHLEPRAAYHIGEIVNRFIALPPKSGSGPKPLAMFVTNTGRVVTLSIVHDNDAVQLTRLEMKMGNAIKGLGDVSHADWRAPKLLHSGTKPPPRRGVTDGDFIKTFLELDPQLASKILSEGSAAERIGPAEEEQIRSCLDALSTVQ